MSIKNVLRFPDETQHIIIMSYNMLFLVSIHSLKRRAFLEQTQVPSEAQRTLLVPTNTSRLLLVGELANLE